jgi:hypothetical protein
MDSVLQKDKECYYCGTVLGLEEHHVFFGRKCRSLSEKYGLKVWLCNLHHTGGNDCPHRNRKVDLAYKGIAQRYFEREVGSREDFVRLFGKSYL